MLHTALYKKALALALASAIMLRVGLSAHSHSVLTKTRELSFVD